MVTVPMLAMCCVCKRVAEEAPLSSASSLSLQLVCGPSGSRQKIFRHLGHRR